MPRTKLDKYSLKYQINIEARTIKIAMARNGYFTNKALADRIHTTPSYLSRGFRKGFSHAMKLRMHKALKFTAEEIALLNEWERL